jgi:deoxyribonuclease-4
MTKKQQKAGPLIGAHMSIAGGLERALTRGSKLRCKTVQMFLANQRQWVHPRVNNDVKRRFRETVEETGISPIIAHASYLVNPATPNDRLWKRTIRALAEELKACTMLKIPVLVVHPGAHTGAGEKFGLKRIADALDRAFSRADESNSSIALEATAGEGTVLGYRFDQLAAIISMSRNPDRLSACIDTSHIFAAGYDISTRNGLRDTLREFDKTVGFDRLTCFHFNDSTGECGSRLDRHWHIGLGKIGKRAFRSILLDERFAGTPKILETPKDKPGKRKWDAVNLALLRRLARS